MYLLPPPGTYIVLLGIIVFLVVFWPGKLWLRAACFSTALVLAGLELHNLYRESDRRTSQEEISRKEELDTLKAIADSIAVSVTKNQEVFDASIEQMKTLAAAGKDRFNEVTGGESFCYVDMGSIPEGLMANLIHKGRYALSDVRVSITDANALDAARKSGASTLASATRSFPIVDFLGKASLFHPLGVYRIEPKEEYLRYHIAIEARNGSFTELLRLRKLREGGWTAATLVAASYVTTKKKGIVLENVQPQFPTELLKTDEDWNRLKKLSVLKLAE